MNLGEKTIELAAQSIGVHEEKPNWGKWVQVYLKFVGIFFPAPWCAAFVAYKVHQATDRLGIKSRWPRTGSVQAVVDWAKRNRLIASKPAAGFAFAIYEPSLHRYGHIGFIREVYPNGEFQTIEGNSNKTGSREGYEVASNTRIWNPDTFLAIKIA